MSIWDLRQTLESHTPAWILILELILAMGIAFWLMRRR